MTKVIEPLPLTRKPTKKKALVEEDVNDLRLRAEAYVDSGRTIPYDLFAQEYGVSRSTIYHAIHGLGAYAYV